MSPDLQEFCNDMAMATYILLQGGVLVRGHSVCEDLWCPRHTLLAAWYAKQQQMVAASQT